MAALASQRGTEFGFRFLLGLGGDGPKQPDFVLPQQLDSALRQRIAFFDPALPTDVGMYIFSFKSDSVEYANGLGQHLIANAIAGMTTIVCFAMIAGSCYFEMSSRVEAAFIGPPHSRIVWNHIPVPIVRTPTLWDT